MANISKVVVGVMPAGKVNFATKRFARKAITGTNAIKFALAKAIQLKCAFSLKLLTLK